MVYFQVVVIDKKTFLTVFFRKCLSMDEAKEEKEKIEKGIDKKNYEIYIHRTKKRFFCPKEKFQKFYDEKYEL